MFTTILVLPAVAVLATLLYASYLDIRDRRVPFPTWYPMLVIGIPAAAWFFYSQKGNVSLAAGFLSLAAVLLYTAYLDRRTTNDPKIYPLLALVLVLPVLAWFVIPGNLSFTLLPWYVMFAGILGYVSYLDTRGKTPPLRKWFPVLVMIVFTFAAFDLMSRGIWDSSAGYLELAAVFCGIFYLFATMNFFGGADAWALIFISLCIPAFPAVPILGESPLGFLPFSVLVNAVILNLAAPIGIFLLNIARGNRGPAAGLFFGFPVDGKNIRNAWGFVMEDITEKNGEIERKFIRFGDAMRRMVEDKGRIYTKDLREHPEKYRKELALYEKAGKVWISYAVPFIVPITAGLLIALVFGDILFAAMRLIFGA